MRTLVSSKNRKKLLRLFLDKPEESIGVRAAAKECKMSPASVSLFLSSLEKERLFRKGRPDLENPEIRALKILFNVETLKPAFDSLKRKFGISGMGMYGSWAKGNNTSASDLDVWIMLPEEPRPQKNNEIRQSLRKAVGIMEISIVFLTKRRLEDLMRKDSVFYYTLYHSFHIGGEQIA